MSPRSLLQSLAGLFGPQPTTVRCFLELLDRRNPWAWFFFERWEGVFARARSLALNRAVRCCTLSNVSSYPECGLEEYFYLPRLESLFLGGWPCPGGTSFLCPTATKKQKQRKRLQTPALKCRMRVSRHVGPHAAHVNGTTTRSRNPTAPASGANTLRPHARCLHYPVLTLPSCAGVRRG